VLVLALAFALLVLAGARVAVHVLGDLVGGVIGLLLGGLVRLRHVVVLERLLFVWFGLALYAGALPLHHVRELVREQPIAFFRAGRELPAAEVHVVADGERPRAERARGRRRLAARAHLDVAEGRLELLLHLLA